MAKPKIIIADTDEMYLSSLEIKFIEEINEIVDIEIITDTSYFNEHFSNPQSADVLIVSENLYFSDLQKQNISHIYLLSENDEEGSTEDLGVDKIFKYTNTNEIYNQIIVTSGINNTGTIKPKETIIVLVYSAAGGVGKTTLSMAMCSCLSRNFKKTLYINAHRVNSFQFYLSNQASMPNNIYTEFATVDSNIYSRIKYAIRNEGFDYLPPFGAALSSVNLDFSIYESIIKSAKASKDYDVIVVDSDTAFDFSKASLITMADKVLIITTQSKASVNATNMLLKNMNCSEEDKYIFLCNKFNTDELNALMGTDGLKPNFTVNEYIKCIKNIDSISLTEISNDSDIKKIPLLVI